MIPALQQQFADAILPTFTQAFSQAAELTRRPMAVPFEAARQQYSLAVRVGLQPNSMLAYRDHFKTLDQLEKAALGPFARQL